MKEVLGFFIAGGILMWPLTLVFVIGVFVIIERSAYWKKLKSTYSTQDVELVYTYLTHKQHDLAKEVYSSSDDPSLKCLRHCLASKGRIHTQILQSLGQQLLDQSKKNFRLLETLITVSPLLGILGTVVGIILSIGSLSSQPDAAVPDSQLMMAGLSQALITTAVGLVLSITFLLFYNHYISAYEKLKSKLERDLSALESLIS
ncbi:MAG: MotA/TolQ/ExbB proton channel family protein [Bdellovibrionaceae bacterium]|nr:MotA/TolQ/ExbB proton channel family protein [Pseudobdellovibrionaceae bacterium]